MASRARDEHVRHGREVGDEFLAVGALAEEKGKLGVGAAPRLGLEHFAEGYTRGLAVWDLDADPVFAGNRRLDADRLCVQRALEVVGEVRDGRIARAGSELDRVLRHDRPLHRVAQLRVHAKELERRDEALAHLADVAVVGRARAQRIEQGERRQDVRTLVLDFLFLLVLCFVGAPCGRWRRFVLQRCARGCLRRFAFGLCRLLRRADRVLLGLACSRLFGLCALLFETGLLLRVFLRLERCEIGGLLLLVLLVGTSGFARRRDVPASRGPAVEPSEETGDGLPADASDKRDEGDDCHHRGAAEVAQKRRHESRHYEVADCATGVRDVDALKRCGNSWRVVLGDLQKACARGEEDREPWCAADKVQPMPGDEAQPEHYADYRDYPHGKADRGVAAVGERVSKRANPVRRRKRGHVECLD